MDEQTPAAEAAPETTTQAAEAPAPAPAPAITSETAPAEPPRHRLIGRETRRFEFPLTVEERARIGDRVGNLGRRLRELEREHDTETERAKAQIAAAKSEASEEASKRREEIKEAAEEFDTALEAQTTGVERRSVEVERRAVLATSTIEVVRVDTGDVVETRPMQAIEIAKYVRQGTIEDATGGATVKVGVVDSSANGTDDDEAPESDEPAKPSDALDEGEAEALGLPVGWPRSWRGRQWVVKGEALREGDVLEVYLRLRAAGATIDEVLDGTEGVQGVATMGVTRASVGRALSLLKGKGLAVRVEGSKPATWSPIDKRTGPAPEPEHEPGRTDTLPEAGDAPRVRRIGKRATKADRLVNAAAEQSDGWGLAPTVEG